MQATLNSSLEIPWWKEPTKDQWLAWIAAWLGWTLDAFDFTMFLLIMVPISQEFHVPLTEVAFVLSVTLWLRLVGAVGSGWLADRIGRKIPLMISILWYSLSNFAAGFSPTFTYLFIFRALLEIDSSGARLVSRNRNRFRHLDTLAGALAKRLRVTDAILDGEIICADERGARGRRNQRTRHLRMEGIQFPQSSLEREVPGTIGGGPCRPQPCLLEASPGGKSRPRTNG